jgi:hypothetical protein
MANLPDLNLIPIVEFLKDLFTSSREVAVAFWGFLGKLWDLITLVFRGIRGLLPF